MPRRTFCSASICSPTSGSPLTSNNRAISYPVIHYFIFPPTLPDVDLWQVLLALLLVGKYFWALTHPAIFLNSFFWRSPGGLENRTPRWGCRPHLSLLGGTRSGCWCHPLPLWSVTDGPSCLLIFDGESVSIASLDEAPTLNQPFYTVIPTHRPNKLPFTALWGHGGHILDFTPGLTGVDYTRPIKCRGNCRSPRYRASGGDQRPSPRITYY